MVKNPREAPGPGPVRPLNLPVPVDVEEDEHQRPVSLVLRRRRLRVVAIDDQWEIADEWWRAGPVTRRYYEVTTEDGASVTVFCDVVGGGWYQQRG